jgi:anti-sigma B factor antagonist
MPDAPKPALLVDVASDPVAVRVEGRASFQNSASLQDLFKRLLGEGRTRFVIDFSGCSSMDSTFLGVLAGAALQVRKTTPPGSLVVARVAPRNLELVRNLGLHRILTVDAEMGPVALGTAAAALPAEKLSELENARLVLEAHKNLVTADEANRVRFEDVMTFLKKRVDEG